jgi:hypothetical protein
VQERSARSEVINVMQGFSKTLPLYVWLVALPQLISRICHPHLETQRITQHILTRVTSAYPQQVCWLSPLVLVGTGLTCCARRPRKWVPLESRQTNRGPQPALWPGPSSTAFATGHAP